MSKRCVENVAYLSSHRQCRAFAQKSGEYCRAHRPMPKTAPPDLAERIYWRLVNDGELRRTGIGPKALVLAAIREEIERGR